MSITDTANTNTNTTFRAPSPGTRWGLIALPGTWNPALTRYGLAPHEVTQ